MPNDFQPGPHLSPDQLSAFAENVLPEHERLLALTHLADCPDCRQTVFLAQQADPSLAAAPAIETSRRSWLSLPQFLIATSAALACTLILALIVHFHQGQTTPTVTTAKLDTPPPIASPTAIPAPVPPNSAATASPAGVAQLSTAAAHSSAESRTSASLSPRTLPKAVPQPILSPPSTSLGASYHGNISDRLNSTHSVDSEMKAESYSDTGSGARGVPIAVPPKAPGAGAGAAMPGSSNTPADLGMRQSAMAAAKQQKDAPAYAANSAVQIAGANSITVNGADVDGLSPTGRSAPPMLMPAPPAPPPIHLPSNKPVASRLYAGSRTLALDTAGALFITYDSGQHWSAVSPQWPGKAVQLSFAASPARLYQVQPQQNQTQSNGSNNASVTTGAAASGIAQQSQQTITPTAGFELTTSSGAVWLSTDGLTWRPR